MNTIARTTARQLAYDVVHDVFGPEQRGAQASFDVRQRRAGLDARDRAFAAELAYGTVKNLRLIDWYLAPYTGGREKPLPPTIVDVLRLGMYQVRFMSGVDDHAAVSETVNLAWKHGHKGTAGLVNAVLRRTIADGPRALAAEDFKTDDDFAGMRYSVPTWIAAQFSRAYGDKRDAALAGVNSAPQHAVRVNTLRASVEAVATELADRGVGARVSAFVPESLIVGSGTAGDDLEGQWSVQSESATMPVDLLAPQPGETVLDMCAGRGNKTVMLAARLENSGSVVAVEIDRKKISVLTEHLERSGVTNAAVVEGDALTAAIDVRANAILLDAPCSGIGVIGRHPEARWRKRFDDGARLAETQAQLLRAAATRCAPGGRIVYSVCSSDPREGRERIDAFLAEEPGFARAPIPERYAEFMVDGDVVVPAGIEGRDGFYIASLVRT